MVIDAVVAKHELTPIDIKKYELVIYQVCVLIDMIERYTMTPW